MPLDSDFRSIDCTNYIKYWKSCRIPINKESIMLLNDVSEFLQVECENLPPASGLPAAAGSLKIVLSDPELR